MKTHPVSVCVTQAAPRRANLGADVKRRVSSESSVDCVSVCPVSLHGHCHEVNALRRERLLVGVYVSPQRSPAAMDPQAKRVKASLPGSVARIVNEPADESAVDMWCVCASACVAALLLIVAHQCRSLQPVGAE